MTDRKKYETFSVEGNSTFGDATTTDTTYQLTALSNRVATTLTVTAFDAAGNSRISNAAVVLPFSLAVTINELAWAGTKASAQD